LFICSVCSFGCILLCDTLRNMQQHAAAATAATTTTTEMTAAALAALATKFMTALIHVQHTEKHIHTHTHTYMHSCTQLDHFAVCVLVLWHMPHNLPFAAAIFVVVCCCCCSCSCCTFRPTAAAS